MLSNAAWNAFLKTLEEPPKNVIFILATTEIQKVPITVLSRCQRFDFSRIDRKLIQEHLIDICKKENIQYDEQSIIEISYLSDGCMRDALSILDQMSKVSDNVTMDVLKQYYGTVNDDDINKIYKDILYNDLDELISDINNIKESGVDIKILINKMIENFINKAIDIKKKNMSNVSFNHIKSIIAVLNDLLTNISNINNSYLILELNLLSFINSDDNKMSSREIEQIISKEIIPDSIYEQDKTYYKICDKFINIRVNNAFVDASKELKTELLTKWEEFKQFVKKNDIKQLLSVVKDSTPVVVSSTNVIVTNKRPAIKTNGNNKLDLLESKFNAEYNTNYKFIYITNDEWTNIAKSFDKTKKYEYMDDFEYINNNDSQGLAENLFGNDISVE